MERKIESLFNPVLCVWQWLGSDNDPKTKHVQIYTFKLCVVHILILMSHLYESTACNMVANVMK